MGGSSKPVTEAEEPEIFGIEPDSTMSSQENVPLPYFVGSGRFPLKMITDIHLRRTKFRSSGKSKGGQGVTYRYGSFGAVFAAGPIDFISEILVAGRVVWAGYVERDETNPIYADIVSEEGDYRIYWGTDDQTLDTFLFTDITARDGIEFPAYKGIPYAACRNVFFGSGDRPSNIEFNVGRAPHFAPSTLMKNLTFEGGSAVACASEVLMSTLCGAGLDKDEAIDEASWAQASSDTVYPEAYPVDDNPEHIASYGYISPKYTSITTTKRALLDMLSYVDAFVSVRGDKLHVGISRHDGTTPSGLPEVTHHDFVSTPRVAAVKKDKYSRIITNYRDRSLKFKKVILVSELGGHAEDSNGARTTKKLDLDAYVSPWQAQRFASRAALINKIRTNTVIGRVFNDSLQGRGIGDKMTVNLPASELDVDCIISRIERKPGLLYSTVTFTQDASSVPRPYTEPFDLKPVIDISTPTQILYYRILQITKKDVVDQPQVIIFAEAPQSDSGGFFIHYSDDNATYDEIADQDSYALKGELVGAIDASATTIRVFADGDDLSYLESQSEPNQRADELIMLIDDEIVSIGDVTALGGNEFDIEVLRARQNTDAAAHDDEAVVWIAIRDNLVVMKYEGFPKTSEIIYFKLQPYNYFGSAPLSESASIAYTFISEKLRPATNLVIESGDDWLVKKASAVHSTAHVTWDEPEDVGRSGWEVQWATALHAGLSLWSSAIVENSGFTTGVVSDEVEYYFRVRPISIDGYKGEWLQVAHVIEGKETPPSNPTNLVATPLVGGVQFTFTPSTDSDLKSTFVYVQTSPVLNLVYAYPTEVIGGSFTRHGMSPENTYYFWAASWDGRRFSGFVGPVSAVPLPQPVGTIQKFEVLEPVSNYTEVAAGGYIEIDKSLPGAAVGDVVAVTPRSALTPYNLAAEVVVGENLLKIYVKNNGGVPFSTFDLDFDGTWIPGDGVNTGPPAEEVPDLEPEASSAWLDLSLGTEETLDHIYASSEWLDLSAGTEETGTT